MTGDCVSSTRLYGIFSGMKSRCNNPKNQSYRWYGSKGIKVCDEWSAPDGASKFISWALSHGYEDGLSIDRINPDADYSPENCRWVSKEINSARMDRYRKGKNSEIFRFIEDNNGKIKMIGYCNNAAEITLMDGSVHRFSLSN